MLYAGLRRGEALALDIDRDVDFEQRLIHVRHAVRYDDNKPTLSDPKTEAGVRDIPLLSVLADELRGHHGLLISSRDGRLLTQGSMQSAWKSYIAALETESNGHIKRWHHRMLGDCDQYPELHRQMEQLIRDGKTDEAEAIRLSDWQTYPIRTHDLRHSYCTMLRDSGVDLKIAMQWMGHADEKMILRIYDHITERRVNQAIKNVEMMLTSRQNSRHEGENSPKSVIV